MNLNDMMAIGGYTIMTIVTFVVYMKFFSKLEDDGPGKQLLDQSAVTVGFYISFAAFLAVCWPAFIWVFPIIWLIEAIGSLVKRIKQ